MNQEYQVFLETYDSGQIAFLKSLLDANSIRYFVENENVATFFSRSGIPLVLKIFHEDFEKASELLRDYSGGDEARGEERGQK